MADDLSTSIPAVYLDFLTRGGWSRC